ncbi:FAD-dependent oxidoreductase [Emcibacter sp.]|uniref:oxidoreductase n=1 Tax=Emcibacter sp. TaxID=1979954 RepID=UPI002AA855C7|nr:FAD-dependent oxidoreductase [Emcibacter sp.]
MSVAKHHAILFEPVAIGPVTAPNRFYQVPQCNGMGHRYPESMAAMREMKAEGGWGTVCTEECEIHPGSDLSPGALMRLWDDSDLPTHINMVDKVHVHGSLAGIELVHNGSHASNDFSRIVPVAPTHIPCDNDPYQAREMSKADIKSFRQWHRDAALRARQAGYDIIYTYAGHNYTLLMKFLSARYNQRSDEYGGCLENRVRLLKEVLMDTRDAVGDKCAVALRLAVDELMGSEGLRCEEEGREIVSLLADIPDLWDVNLSGWENDTQGSRWAKEGYQEDFVRFVKQTTSKPVVGVGRFTSPDTMVSMIRRGVIDLIGAARPSIADPFLPQKIKQGRTDEIRECIGCNMCTVGDFKGVPIRCTQNPTMGEEFRKGWHPEKIDPARSEDKVLVVGAGPAGLECALALANRGYEVVLAEKSKILGGHLHHVATGLPGLQEWIRVVDYRSLLLSRHPRVNIYRDSPLTSEDILAFGFERVVISTGARWRTDGLGRSHYMPIPVDGSCQVLSVDDILKGRVPDAGRTVVVYDDDHYFMANCIAEKLHDQGCRVIYVTTEDRVAGWTEQTLEQRRIQARLLNLGVEIICSRNIVEIRQGKFHLSCTYTDRPSELQADCFIPVTSRAPQDALYQDYLSQPQVYRATGIKEVVAIGDCFAPGTIAQAVYSGHQYARQLDNPVDISLHFKRENNLVFSG